MSTQSRKKTDAHAYRRSPRARCLRPLISRMNPGSVPQQPPITSTPAATSAGTKDGVLLGGERVGDLAGRRSAGCPAFALTHRGRAVSPRSSGRQRHVVLDAGSAVGADQRRPGFLGAPHALLGRVAHHGAVALGRPVVGHAGDHGHAVRSPRRRARRRPSPPRPSSTPRRSSPPRRRRAPRACSANASYSSSAVTSPRARNRALGPMSPATSGPAGR